MWFLPALNRIALSVVDIRVTERWFREGLGLLPAGGSRLMMRGLLPSRVQGLPGAASTCWWLVGRLLDAALDRQLKPLIECG